ncbi:MAG TPA: DUF4252 domain-containing protein [Bacteroidales bacterium]|nr:DUF4252 domain-containing protein [Bacteroidales bacterium]
MKNILIVFLAVCSIVTYAQQSPVEKVIDKFDGKAGISVQDISSGTETWDKLMKTDKVELREVLAKMETLKIVNCDTKEASLSTCKKFHEKLDNSVEDKRYAEILQVHGDDGEQVGFHISQLEDGSLREVVLLVDQGKGFLLVYMKGTIDMSSLNLGDIMSAFSGKPGEKD